MAPVWHVRGAFAGLDFEVIGRDVDIRIIQLILAHARVQRTERILQRDGRSTAARSPGELKQQRPCVRVPTIAHTCNVVRLTVCASEIQVFRAERVGPDALRLIECKGGALIHGV